jgi:D-alanyl-D-alanine carboxypeptidase/D-alanyl-D-alanine-endopeptidase (penicillin-binding protein 4)
MPNRLLASFVALAFGFSILSAPVQPAEAATNCSVAQNLKNPLLGKFYGSVIDVATGKQILGVRSDEQTPSASVLKVITAAAGIIYLGPNYRAETKVFYSENDATLYLVGGGDHTLSRYDPPSYTTYKTPPRISKLASQTLKAVGSVSLIKKIVVDQTFFDENGFNPAWKATDRTNGYITPIAALMVDANKNNADLTSSKYDSWRSTDPALKAGRVFKVALGAQAAGANVVIGTLGSNADLVSTVSSAPMSVWLDHAVKVSDNTETEMIMRHVQKATGAATRFDGIQKMAETTLDFLGLGHKGLVMRDASGLAQTDRVTPRMIAKLLVLAADPASPIADLSNYLATTSSYGTVANRFRGDAAVARGSVRAKSGYIPGLSSLAGLVKAKDGKTFAFAFFARTYEKEGFKIGYGARDAIDGLVAKTYLCSVKLTDGKPIKKPARLTPKS